MFCCGLAPDIVRIPEEEPDTFGSVESGCGCSTDPSGAAKMHNSGKTQRRRIAPEHIRIELVRTELLPVSIASTMDAGWYPKGYPPYPHSRLAAGSTRPAIPTIRRVPG